MILPQSEYEITCIVWKFPFFIRKKTNVRTQMIFSGIELFNIGNTLMEAQYFILKTS